MSRRAVVVLVLLVCGRSAAFAQATGALQIHYLDVTAGAAAVLVSPGGEVVLFDDGLASDCGKPLAYLQSLGIAKIDYLVADRFSADRRGCAKTIVSLFPLQKAAFDRGQSHPTAAYAEYVSAVGAKRQIALDRAQITLDASSIAPVTIELVAHDRIGPAANDPDEENLRAIVRFGNFDAELWGDLGASTGRFEVYQTRHHGRRSPALASSRSRLDARIAVASMGTSDLRGDPTEDYVDRLHAVAPKTFWTGVGSGVAPVADLDVVSGDLVVEVLPGASTFTVRYRGSAETYAMWDATVSSSRAASLAPFGIVDTPQQGATGVTGAIAVTGWALDDQEVATVRILRSPVGAEPAGTNVFIGNAVFVTGTRPDVAAAFPSLPFKDRAGWGYLLLTNLLPGQGNGPYTLWIYADDRDGNSTFLGTRTITCANATAKKPFGTIDTPGQGEAISGSSYINFGWVLTPQPATIPFDGSTIDVYVDNVLAGHPVYNNFRADIAGLFPGLNNSNGASGYFALNTSTLTNGTHTIAWIARDNGGNSEGIGSRYFSFCSSPFSISPTSRSHSASAEGSTVNVTAGNGCLWTAASNASWITITAGTSGSSSGVVSYSVAANPSVTPRSGTLTIAGETFTVTQAGAACAPAISPTNRSHGTGTETGTVTVTAAIGCSWTATSNANWIALIGGSTGSGDGTVSYSVAANTDTSARAGTLTIDGQTFTVTQAGTVCSPTLSPASRSHGAGAETGTVNITLATGCAWTASSNASWITITAGSSGSGTGAVAYAVAANLEAGPRTGTLTIAGQIFVVTQAGATCAPAMSPTSRSHGAGAETGTVSVTAVSGCTWTALSGASWITITAGNSGSGNGAVSYIVAANTDASVRTGTLTIAGQTFTVTQAGAACTPTISPTSRSHGAGAETGTVSVTAGSGCTWTAVSNVTWITVIAGSSGSANGTVSYNVAANADASTRTGTVTIAGRVFTVTQAGAACTFSISPTSRSHGAAAETGTVSVTAGSGCTWTAASNVTWITITGGSSGSGNGNVSYSVAANTGSARTGTLTIAGQTFTVTQSAGQTSFVVTITASGVSPKTLVVPLGTQVMFVNNSSQSHDMTSDPHPEHTDCPELNQVGFIQPGQSRQTGNLVTPRTCGYHDHDNPLNNALKGSIVIQSSITVKKSS